MDESAKSPNFFHDCKPNKPERKYTTTRIESRNLLSNISYAAERMYATALLQG